MTMQEMQKVIAKLRFLLASIKGKKEELEGLSRQFRRQLDRARSYAIRGDNSSTRRSACSGRFRSGWTTSKALDATLTPSSLALKTSCER